MVRFAPRGVVRCVGGAPGPVGNLIPPSGAVGANPVPVPPGLGEPGRRAPCSGAVNGLLKGYGLPLFPGQHHGQVSGPALRGRSKLGRDSKFATPRQRQHTPIRTTSGDKRSEGSYVLFRGLPFEEAALQVAEMAVTARLGSVRTPAEISGLARLGTPAHRSSLAARPVPD